MPLLSAEELARRANDIEWLLCDVDGVLTDGGLYYDRRGHQLLRFDVKDGLALVLARRAGLKIGVLSARSSPALERRASELKLDAVISGSRDKGADFEAFLVDQNTAARRVAFIGDDLTDLILLGRCGLAFAPSDAVEEVQAVAHHVLSASGGRGAVRQMVELVLKARGEWESLLTPFTFEG
jgi:3-deoxy-D-manno-octulosonate 8-phosphate phosphatase (KDO 8-P phosphatase)